VATTDAFGYDSLELRRQIESMFNALGGLSDIIKPGDAVGMKINLTGGSGSTAVYNVPACELYWTHPEVVRAVGGLAKDAGAGKLYILEALYDRNSYDGFGFKDVADYLGATLVDLSAKAPYADFVERPVGDGWLIYDQFTQNAILNDIQCLISLPKAKQHNGAGVTHSMKNLVGSVPLGLYGNGQSYRVSFHQHQEYDHNASSNLRRIVIDLNKATKIHLAVTDAIKTTLGSEGPWNGDLVPIAFNKLVAGKDVVAADSIATQVIGFDPMAADGDGVFAGGINYLRLAQEKGLGVYDTTRISVVDATVSNGVRERRPRS
jgi:uncharacterized protein (DUF362 family)